MNAVSIINQSQTSHALQNKNSVLELVAAAYKAHRVNPEQTPRSHFLRFADRPADRIIALLSRFTNSTGRDYAGVKWVSSFPANLESGRPRAFASIVLNDMQTGYPVAFIAASPINAARTAASAALAADSIYRTRGNGPGSIGLIGAGYIGVSILDYLHHLGLSAPVAVHDNDPVRAAELTHSIGVTQTLGLEQALDSDLVVFATTAQAPFVSRPFRDGQVVLHVSLRDLEPSVLLDAQNIVDDAEHAVREGTSLQLASSEVGHLDFINGTIPELLAGEVSLDNRPVIVSPFGLGILDIAAAVHVLDNTAHPAIVEFF